AIARSSRRKQRRVCYRFALGTRFFKADHLEAHLPHRNAVGLFEGRADTLTQAFVHFTKTLILIEPHSDMHIHIAALLAEGDPWSAGSTDRFASEVNKMAQRLGSNCRNATLIAVNAKVAAI